MVAGYHLMWTAYGCWLPNDPRGSMSEQLRVESLGGLGEVHTGRKKVQPGSAELRAFYERADELLAHTRFILSDEDGAVVAAAFAEGVRTQHYTCYACAIMPDHVHLLIRRHRDRSETMIENLQEQSKGALIEAGRRPVNHPVWGGPGWRVYLNTRADIERIVKYIRNNPLKIGRPEQHWDFVTKYDGWMPPYRR